MIWHLHDYGKWEDVKLGDKVKPVPHSVLLVVVRQTITQQRRCCVCNLVQTRYTA